MVEAIRYIKHPFDYEPKRQMNQSVRFGTFEKKKELPIKKIEKVEEVEQSKIGNGGNTEYNKLRGLLRRGKLTDSQQVSLGCVLGAFVGDSMGSYLEFEKNAIPEWRVDRGMAMPGGGPWKVAPGQITDDSELAMCSMYALIDGDGILDLNSQA